MPRLNADIKLHNKFEIEVRDAKTGKLKQELRAYNVVTDRYFTSIFDGESPVAYMALGTGSGTPSVSDTDLFNRVGWYAAENVETAYAYPTSHTKKSMVLTNSQLNGMTLSEIGFCKTHMGLSSRYFDYVTTHAMLEDTDGNPITFTKTENDIVTIYGTVYCTVTYPNNRSYIIPAVASDNALLKTCLVGALPATTMRYGPKLTTSTTDSMIMAKRRFSSTKSNTRTVNSTARTIKYKAAQVAYNEMNNMMLGSFGVPDIAIWGLPNASVFPPQTIRGLAVGEGDGQTTGFKIPVPEFVSDSDVVYLDGAQLVRGTDYTILDFQPSSDYADMLPCATSDNVAFKQRWLNSSYDYDVMTATNDKTSKTVIPPNDSSHSNPVCFDFKTVQSFNRVSINAKSLMIGSSGGSNFTLYCEYSTDGENFTRAAAITSSSASDLVTVSFATVQARYWRIVNASTSLTVHAIAWPNLSIWYYEPALVFTNPPSLGSLITMDCTIDRPIKNENWVLDCEFTVSFTRG